MVFRLIADRALRAINPPAPEPRPPAPAIPLFYDFVTSGLEAAFEAACERLQVTSIQSPRRVPGSKSCGGPVEARDGTAGWVKVSGVPSGHENIRRERERSARAIANVRTPELLATTEWMSGAIEWQAVLTRFVALPDINQFVSDAGGSLARNDDWIAQLRATLNQIAAIPTAHYCLTEQYVAGAIVARFGPDAPRVAGEWHTAHGDLNWGNLTVPDLVVYDWETWGLAPRAYDAAYLMVHSFLDPNFMARLESEFSDEFSTESGCVGLLVACAEMLDFIEARRHDEHHGRNIKAIAHRGLARYFEAASGVRD